VGVAETDDLWSNLILGSAQPLHQAPPVPAGQPAHAGQPAYAGQPAQAGYPVRSAPADRRVSWSLRVEVRRVQRILVLVAATLVVLDFLASAAAALGAPYELTRFFDADAKVNFPTGFKTTMLLTVTLLLLAEWSFALYERSRFAPAWRLLAAVTGFAFLDETIYLHQSLATILHSHLHTTGPLVYAWTIVYAPVAAMVVIIVLRYIRYLDRALMWRLILGGGLYVVGTLAFEPVKSEIAESRGDSGLPFKLTAAISDSMEMIGLTVLAIILLTELARTTRVIGLTLDRGRAQR
jgi:hypothetical protein